MILQQNAGESLCNLLFLCTSSVLTCNDEILAGLCKILYSSENLLGPNTAEEIESNNETQRLQTISERGASYTLTTIAKFGGEQLFQSLPLLWTFSISPLKFESLQLVKDEDIIHSLHLLKVLVPALHPSLHSMVVCILF